MKLLVLKYSDQYVVAMGDLIDCVPLINYIASKETDPIMLPTFQHYVANVKSFFPANGKIQVYGLNSFNDYDYYRGVMKSIEIVASNPNDKPNHYPHWEIATLYDAAGYDYKMRKPYDTILTRYKEVEQVEPPSVPYAFVPEGGSEKRHRIDRHFISGGLEIVVPPQDGMMLSYASMIENAKEIHCHVTAYERLVDKLPTNGKLFLHHYVRAANQQPEVFHKFGRLTKPWTQLLHSYGA